jgi:8-oxo-dGTP pyrophosphatase MutT (NUDIX family)
VPAKNEPLPCRAQAQGISFQAISPPADHRSIVLISPINQVLLLHRVETSSSFPSAHVFPGGNVSAPHDGRVPDPEHPGRHVDSDVYRMAAIRETFEESGILLARNKQTGKLLHVSDAERERARKDISQNKITFPAWLAGHSGVADIGSCLAAS